MMNKYQKALNMLRKEYLNNESKECDLLQELVDKATPKKPYYKDIDEPLCPYCHNPLCEPEELCECCD